MKSKEQKRREALARQKVCDNMSPFQRLSRLDGLFGFSRGARKERGQLTSGMTRYIQRSGCAYQHKKGLGMAPAHVAPEDNVIKSPEEIERKEAEEKAKEEAKVGMQTPLVEKTVEIVIPKPRVRYVIPTVGKEQEAR